MTSFGWKRKRANLAHQSSSADFEEKDERGLGLEESEEIDRPSSSKRQRGGALEDAATKAAKLKSEGIALAESGRFSKAIRIWDEALALSPGDARLHEMKAQALLELREDFAAVHAAEEAVRCDRSWSIARQTLGRAQLNLGELHMALQCFCIALHLEPWSTELRDEDIERTLSILDKARKRAAGEHKDTTAEKDEDESESGPEHDKIRSRSALL